VSGQSSLAEGVLASLKSGLQGGRPIDWLRSAKASKRLKGPSTMVATPQARKRRAPRKGTVSGPQRRKAALRRVDQDPTFRIASALRSQSEARQASGRE